MFCDVSQALPTISTYQSGHTDKTVRNRPTSGGLYYASAVLAPPGWGPLASWVTGWSNWLGQVTGAPSVNYGTAAMILACASIQNPSYVPTNYQTFLLTVLLMWIHGIMASLPTRWLAKINNVGSTFNIIALIIVLILIPAACDRTAYGLGKFNASSAVWGDIYQGTDFPDGISVLMSFIGIIWTMSGFDSPFHLAEECSNANIASPRAIFLTSAVGGTFGWFLQLVVAYTVVDITGALDSSLGQPFAAYLVQILPQRIVLAVLSLTIIAGFAMGQGCMIAASRVTVSPSPPSFSRPALDSSLSLPLSRVLSNKKSDMGRGFLSSPMPATTASPLANTGSTSTRARRRLSTPSGSTTSSAPCSSFSSSGES